MSHVVTRSRYFREATEGRSVDVETDMSTLAGVRVIELGNKKGSQVELYLPRGSKNVRIALSGRQARSIFLTLARHYDRLGK